LREGYLQETPGAGGKDWGCIDGGAAHRSDELGRGTRLKRAVFIQCKLREG